MWTGSCCKVLFASPNSQFLIYFASLPCQGSRTVVQFTLLWIVAMRHAWIMDIELNTSCTLSDRNGYLQIRLHKKDCICFCWGNFFMQIYNSSMVFVCSEFISFHLYDFIFLLSLSFFKTHSLFTTNNSFPKLASLSCLSSFFPPNLAAILGSFDVNRICSHKKKKAT